MSFVVLYVCTGNVCRSPMAELVFRAWASPTADVSVHSAGTQALVGEQIDRSCASALGQLGIAPGGHLARQLENWMVLDADLVLTAERRHRDQIMTEVPTAFRRTFTMKEFARLCRHQTDSIGDVVTAVANARHLDGAVPEAADNMPDPYRGMIQHARTIAAQVTETVHATIGALRMWPADFPPTAPAVTAPGPQPRRPHPHRRASP